MTDQQTAATDNALLEKRPPLMDEFAAYYPNLNARIDADWLKGASAALEWITKRELASAKALRETLGGVSIDRMNGDNLAILLCTYFENPDQDNDDETGWTPDATEGYEETIRAIHAHYAPTITEAAERIKSLLAEVERLQQAIKRQAGAVRALHANEATEVNILRKGRRDSWAAERTLDSEREANAILTAENERLEADRQRMRDALEAIERIFHEEIKPDGTPDRIILNGEPHEGPLVAWVFRIFRKAGTTARAALNPASKEANDAND